MRDVVNQESRSNSPKFSIGDIVRIVKEAKTWANVGMYDMPDNFKTGDLAEIAWVAPYEAIDRYLGNNGYYRVELANPIDPAYPEDYFDGNEIELVYPGA